MLYLLLEVKKAYRDNRRKCIGKVARPLEAGPLICRKIGKGASTPLQPSPPPRRCSYRPIEYKADVVVP